MDRLVAAFSVVALLLVAGCAGSGKQPASAAAPSSDGPASSSSPGEGDADDSGTSTGAPSSSDAAVHDLSITGENLNGVAPLDVTFSIDGSPPDGASWTLDFGDGSPAEGSSDPAFPATVKHTYASPGTLTATVTAVYPDHASLSRDIKVEALAPGDAPAPAGPPPIFADDAEGDATKWTITSKVYESDPLNEQHMETTADYPGRAWIQDGTNVVGGSKAWYTDYPDMYRGRMVSSTFTVPPEGAVLSFSVFGGAEANNIDGLYVYAGTPDAMTQLDYFTDQLPGWVQTHYDLPGGETQLEFRFDSDSSCSKDTGIPDNPVLACGPGYEGGGFWVDDILVS
jgi:hypothetical protein